MSSINMSEWRPVAGYEGAYEVSPAGEVRSLPRRRTKGGILHPMINKRGYLTVTLGRHKREVHKIVATAFLGPRPDGLEVRHLDGDRLHPATENLTYGTRAENVADAMRHGTHGLMGRTHCPRRHPYDEANTRVYRGRRYCKACARARKRR